MTSTIACQKKNDSKQNQNSNILSSSFSHKLIECHL